ncbi:MAG TPA: response regulator transcription factor [Bacteroidia bacterium]|jgi:DNA-binding NarL/FixJ family response regulator|nr:response regulator transcription factor [Bacteroidia bacterium]
MSQSYKIAVVDDQQLFRKGLISLFQEFEELNVVIEASNGKEFLDKLKCKDPDVVFLDLEMPVMSGIETTEVLKSKFPELKIIILTMHNDEEIILHLIEKGAHGFLLKDEPIENLVDAVYSVMETGYSFNDRVSNAMIRSLVKSKKITPKFSDGKLSDREIEIVKLICKEYSNREIAEKLSLSVRTVDGHRDNIMSKIKAKNVVGVVMYAVKNNLLD